MQKIIIFGAGKIADVAFYYLQNDSPYDIVAFTVDEVHIDAKEKLGLPVIPFEYVQKMFPPDVFKMFVAVGYQDLNRFRTRKYLEAKEKGYELISYVCSRATNFAEIQIGDNCFVLENAVIQPCSRIGSNVFIWSGNHIGHHATVQDHCYIAGQVIIGGSSVIEPYCFLGINSTISHEITVGHTSLIGAGTFITKNVPPGSVYIAPETPKFRLDSESFLRLTKMK